MLSFIIIGRNEGWKLKRCLESVFETINYNKLEDAEVIYVDSRSTDNSIDLARTFKNVKVFLITGECNAAIARNIGAKEAKGEILYFIDGDMEINKEFLLYAIKNNQLKYDCLTGHLDDYLYNYNDEFLGVKSRTYIKEIPEQEQLLKTNGGIFLIKKRVWENVSGLKTKYKVNEDNDLTLRLQKKGVNTIRIPRLITKHHTVDYSNDKRMWNMLKQCYGLYPAVLFREHIVNPTAWNRSLRMNYTVILFVILTITIITNHKWLMLFSALLYFLVFIARGVKNTIDSNISKNKVLFFFERTIFQFLYDLSFLVGFIFFFPKSKKIEYYAVN